MHYIIEVDKQALRQLRNKSEYILSLHFPIDARFDKYKKYQ